MKTIKNTEVNKQKEKDIKQKLMMFDRLPNECLTCHTAFDKLNKEQVKTWFVIVKEEKNIVRLYCPECWKKAQEILADFRKRIEDKNG